MKEMKSIVYLQKIEKTIFMIRGQKIMLSTHLADLYGVEPKVLMQAVKRNIDRFPEDFMFQLSVKEFDNLKSQIVTSSWGGMRRARPFTTGFKSKRNPSFKDYSVFRNYLKEIKKLKCSGSCVEGPQSELGFTINCEIRKCV